MKIHNISVIGKLFLRNGRVLRILSLCLISIFYTSLPFPLLAGHFDSAFEAYYAKNYKKAFELFEALAKKGYSEAQFNVGMMYDFGRGVALNDNKAAYWYRKAAEQGLSEAQYNLGLMYNEGEGVPKSYTQAVLWYRKAAEQNDGEAQYKLSVMYVLGDGVTKNYTKAIHWARSSASLGNPDAQLHLGNLYKKRGNVPGNNAKAYAWYRVAASQGYESANDNKKLMVTRMTLSEIAQANELAVKYWEKFVEPFQTESYFRREKLLPP